MVIQLRLFRQADKLQNTLRDDGWQLEPQEDGSLLARHPQVPSERAARIRLGFLGLLTSSSLAIEFLPVREKNQLSAI